ncbi:hypothetical protein L6452_43233 [Arctium lappa]|uniref:Uncharacterized protein n=1 Tax=Arctium lappa TaxID=4217 RepID=A0ACB8XKE5_ARCLA|nr:hypothetical protein L6452_43233 [Arctium lappa]
MARVKRPVHRESTIEETRPSPRRSRRNQPVVRTPVPNPTTDQVELEDASIAPLVRKSSTRGKTIKPRAGTNNEAVKRGKSSKEGATEDGSKTGEKEVATVDTPPTPNPLAIIVYKDAPSILSSTETPKVSTAPSETLVEGLFTSCSEDNVNEPIASTKIDISLIQTHTKDAQAFGFLQTDGDLATTISSRVAIEDPLEEINTETLSKPVEFDNTSLEDLFGDDDDDMHVVKLITKKKKRPLGKTYATRSRSEIPTAPEVQEPTPKKRRTVRFEDDEDDLEPLETNCHVAASVPHEQTMKEKGKKAKETTVFVTRPEIPHVTP